MGLRTLIALLILPCVGALLGFVTLLIYQIWGSPWPLFLAFARLDYASLTTIDPWLPQVLLSTILISLIFLLLYLLLLRFVAQPVRVIAEAMSSFSATQQLPIMPRFSQGTKEIRLLSKSFITFTARFQEVHAHDLEISRVKSDFIATAAHQLRTPLTGIRWALEALEKEQITPEQKALVESAVAKSHDLVSIVGTLLDISSIESGKHKYVFVNTSMEALVAAIVNDFTAMAAERQVVLTIAPPESPLPMVRADHEQIKWVLNNLIENALRYTPPGGSVRVSYATAPDRVQVLVSDTGIGIAPKDRNNIFERFYRAENAISKENKGNGLGLYIARTVATDHGGDLNFSQNPNGPGTTFTLSLPVAA